MSQMPMRRVVVTVALLGLTSGVWTGCGGKSPNKRATGSTSKAAKPIPASDVQAEEAYQNHCTDSLVVCLDTDGRPFYKDPLPSRIDPGTTLVVQVLAQENFSAGPIQVDITSVRSHNQLFQSPGRRWTKLDGAVPYKPLGKPLSHTVAADTNALEVNIAFVNKESGKSTRYDIPIARGYHYMQVGLLVPFVFRGDRSITAASVPGTELRKAVVSSDTAIDAALGITFYPWGRRNGLLSPWELGYGLRAWGDMVGFQVAKDFNFTQARGNWYLGGVFQPIDGLILSFGVAYHQGTYLASGESSARLYEPDETIPTTTRYMWRPYVGLMFTQDVLGGIKRALAGLKNLRNDG